MNQPRQTVCLIDDHPLFRKGLIQLLQTISDFEVIGEASNGQIGRAHV
jgi:two-component system nitrate/nitrite response regulator NarL